MKLLESTKSKITKDENGENMPCLEVTKVVLFHCNIINIIKNSRVLNTFVPNKWSGQLLDISPKYFFTLKKTQESPYIEVQFTDQNSNLLEIEEKVSITLDIN